MPNEATIPSPGSWFVNALGRSAKGVDNIFFQLSSGAIKKSRRPKFPESFCDRQCWAIEIDDGSTFTPGPMVEEMAMRCR
jgi:hypothetical protein